MADIEDYGKRVDCRFFAHFFQTLPDLADAVCKAAGLLPVPVDAPLADRIQLEKWAFTLHKLCKEKAANEWVASVRYVREALAAPAAHESYRRIEEDKQRRRGRLVGTPLEVAPMRSSLPRGASRASQSRSLRQPPKPATQMLLDLAAEAGEHSGWHRDITAQAAEPRASFEASFEAAMHRPSELKVRHVIRVFARWRKWSDEQTFADSWNVFTR